MYKVGQGRKKVKIEVGKEIFEISFVSTFARKRASDLFKMVDRITKIWALDEPKRTEEYDKLTEDELNDILVSRAECLENLLISNGYEYDKDWWDKFTDDEMQSEFIYYCTAKDTSKKKVVKELKK